MDFWASESFVVFVRCTYLDDGPVLISAHTLGPLLLLYWSSLDVCTLVCDVQRCTLTNAP